MILKLAEAEIGEAVLLIMVPTIEKLLPTAKYQMRYNRQNAMEIFAALSFKPPPIAKTNGNISQSVCLVNTANPIDREKPMPKP